MQEWMGKQKVVNHHNDMPFHVLERKWDYGRDGLRAVRDGLHRLLEYSAMPVRQGELPSIREG